MAVDHERSPIQSNEVSRSLTEADLLWLDQMSDPLELTLEEAKEEIRDVTDAQLEALTDLFAHFQRHGAEE
jgi:hypothetical protein